MKLKILSILEDLSHCNRSKAEIMQECVQERLTQSFSVYSHDLENSINFLTRRHEKSLLKRLNKLDDKIN